MGVKVTTVGAAWTLDGKHVGPGPWLGLIHECNRLTDGKMFGSPEFVNDERGHVESYRDADVIFIGEGAQDQLVTIDTKTMHGTKTVMQAAESMGLQWRGV
jgi:hypothetical protein